MSPKSKFTLTFMLYSIALFTTFYLNPFFFDNLRIITANTLSILLLPLGIQTHVQSTQVIFETIVFDIIHECTALFPSLIYSSAILAYQTKIKKKLWGFLGIPIILTLNQLRLIILSITGINYPQAFTFTHSILWEAIFLIAVIVVFALWIKWGEKK